MGLFSWDFAHLCLINHLFWVPSFMEPPYDMELRRHCEQAWLQSWEKLANLGVSSSWVSKGLSNQWVVQAWIWGWGWSMKLGLPHLIVQNQDSSAMRIMLIMCFAMFLQCLFVPKCRQYTGCFVILKTASKKWTLIASPRAWNNSASPFCWWCSDLAK